MRPLIAIVGSGQPSRDYRPALDHAGDLPAACAEIGRELARGGFDLVVFSSEDDFVEKDVVRGFLEAGPAPDQHVLVRIPARRPVEFDVPGNMVDHVRIEPDASELWEPSFYRAVMSADGLVAIGGGRSTRIAGTIAIAQRTPVVALAWFGAGAAVVWQELDKTPNDATREDLNAMGNPWTSTSAARLAGSLRGQLDRKQAALRDQVRSGRLQRRKRLRTSLVAAVALLLSTASLFLAWTGIDTSEAVALLLLGPMLGAIGGAMLRDTTEQEPDAVWSATRGLGAGLLAATLYISSQLLTTPDLLTVDAVRRLLWFVIPMGIAAGYTFDLIYARLRKVDVALGPLQAEPPPADQAATPAR
jgi:hypothetical protein